MLPGWAIILIIIGIVIVCYFLLGFLFHHLMVKAKVKYLDELAKMTDFEKARGEKVLSILDRMIYKGYEFDKKSYDLILKGSKDFLSLTYEEMSRFKNTIDFTGVFLAKIYKEDPRYGKYITKDESEFLSSTRNKSEEAYKPYNKAATKFNVFQNMIFTRGIMTLRREPKINALIF